MQVEAIRKEQVSLGQCRRRELALTSTAARCPWTSHFRARHDVVLSCDNSPLALAPQPGVCPHLASFRLLACLVLADATFAAVSDRDGVAEETHLDVAQLAVRGERLQVG